MIELGAGKIVVLTHADTDVRAVSALVGPSELGLPLTEAYNVGRLRDADEAEAFLDSVLLDAAVVVLRLHGGAGSFPGTEHLRRSIQAAGAQLVAFPGTDDLDPELTSLSTAPAALVHETQAYLQFGGLVNVRNCLAFLAHQLMGVNAVYDGPAEQPRTGFYHPDVPSGSIAEWQERANPRAATIGLTFYRAYWLIGDTAFVDELVRAGEALGLNVLPVFAYSLKDRDEQDQPEAYRYFASDGRPNVDVVVNTMSFAMGSSGADRYGADEWSADALKVMDVPQLQAINSSLSIAEWQESSNGVSPLDVAMNVAIPELDGRIITVPTAFKGVSGSNGERAIDHVAVSDRAARVMGQAARLATLRRRGNRDKRVAIVLTNHNAKASRIANAVGLDSPASLLSLLGRMRNDGYLIGPLPETPDDLMAQLIERGNYDLDVLTETQLERPAARIETERYHAWLVC